MAKAPTPADTLRARLETERKALLPATEVDLDELREAARLAAEAERDYRRSPARPRYATAADARAIELSAASGQAAAALRAATEAATTAGRRIAQIDATLDAANVAENLRREAGERASTIVALLERRAALAGALAKLRTEADALGRHQAKELDAAAERELAARIDGKAVLRGATIKAIDTINSFVTTPTGQDGTAAELARLHATIGHAERELATGTARVASLRMEGREAEGRYFAAHYLATRLELDGAMLALEPLRIAAEAARQMAGAMPDPPALLDALAVRRAMDGLRAELPRLPADPPEVDATADPENAEPIAATTMPEDAAA